MKKEKWTWIYTACFSRIQEQCIWTTRWQENVQTSSEKTLKKKVQPIDTVAKSYHRKYMKTATKHCPNNSATVEELCFVLCQSLYPYCRLAKLRERSPGFSGRCTIGRGVKFLRVWFFLSLGSHGISVPLVFSSYELSEDLQMDQPICSVVILTSLFVMWSLYEMPRIRWYLIFLYSPAARVRICRNIKKMDFIEMWNMSTVPVQTNIA